MTITVEYRRNRTSTYSANRATAYSTYFSSFELSGLYETVAEEEKASAGQEPLRPTDLELTPLPTEPVQKKKGVDPIDLLPEDEREVLLQQL